MSKCVGSIALALGLLTLVLGMVSRPVLEVWAALTQLSNLIR